MGIEGGIKYDFKPNSEGDSYEEQQERAERESIRDRAELNFTDDFSFWAFRREEPEEFGKQVQWWLTDSPEQAETDEFHHLMETSTSGAWEMFMDLGENRLMAGKITREQFERKLEALGVPEEDKEIAREWMDTNRL